MSSREERADLELERLFKSMDEVRASDELKASTLAAIFDQMDEEANGAAGLEESVAAEETQTVARPVLTLVADDEDAEARDEEAGGQDASVAADEGNAKDASARQDGLEQDDSKKSARPRRRRFGLKVAAVLLLVAVGVGGVLSYAIPASHVTVSAGDTTFDLGVNVYGTTVSATANSDAGKEAISSAEVRNVGFKDALGRLIDAYDQQRGGEQDAVQVSVNDPLGGGERFSNEADRVIEERRPASSPPEETPGQGEGGVPEGAVEPGGAAGPGSENFSPPVQDGGGVPGGGAGPGEGAGPVAEGELGGGSEPSGGGMVAGGGGQEPSGGPMSGGDGMEGSLGGASEQSGMPGQGSAPQNVQGQGLGGPPR